MSDIKDIESIEKEWADDGKIVIEDISWEVTRTPMLHSKYSNKLNEAYIDLKKYESKLNKYKRLRADWLLGRMDKEIMDKLGWEPNNHRILKSEVPSYLEAEQTYINMAEIIEMKKIKIKFLEEIVKRINSRSFDIKNIIEWEKFKNGIV